MLDSEPNTNETSTNEAAGHHAGTAPAPTFNGPAEPALAAVLAGRCVRAPASLAASVVRPRRVLSGYRTIALIHWQARRLRWLGLTTARRRYHQPQPGVVRGC